MISRRGFLGFSDVHTPAAGHLLSIPFQHSMHAGVFLTSIPDQQQESCYSSLHTLHSQMAFSQLLWQNQVNQLKNPYGIYCTTTSTLNTV